MCERKRLTFAYTLELTKNLRNVGECGGHGSERRETHSRGAMKKLSRMLNGGG